MVFSVSGNCDAYYLHIVAHVVLYTNFNLKCCTFYSVQKNQQASQFGKRFSCPGLPIPSRKAKRHQGAPIVIYVQIVHVQGWRWLFGGGKLCSLFDPMYRYGLRRRFSCVVVCLQPDNIQ